MIMDLRHMRYFVAVADELHFTKAAERLHLAQPALSKQIRDLEDELGATLLVRTGRKIALSDAGRVFYEKASQILRDTESAVIETKRAQRGETGKIAVGFFEQTAYTLLPPILRAYRQDFPEVNIQLRWYSVTGQHDALTKGNVDVAFIRFINDGGRAVSPSENLTMHKLHREKFVLAVPVSHPFANRESVATKECADEPFVGYTESFAPDFHAMIMRLCAMSGFLPKTSLEVGQTYTLLGLVSAAVGIAFVPASAQKMKFEGVIFKRLKDELPDIEIYLAWTQRKPSASLAAFVQTAEKVITARSLAGDASFILT
jgi:DNA-binding transcriptional LysR family regulator